MTSPENVLCWMWSVCFIGVTWIRLSTWHRTLSNILPVMSDSWTGSRSVTLISVKCMIKRLLTHRQSEGLGLVTSIGTSITCHATRSWDHRLIHMSHLHTTLHQSEPSSPDNCLININCQQSIIFKALIYLMTTNFLMSFIRSFIPKKLLQTSSDLTWKTVEIRKETDNFTVL